MSVEFRRTFDKYATAESISRFGANLTDLTHFKSVFLNAHRFRRELLLRCLPFRALPSDLFSPSRRPTRLALAR
jgi:hypothetical protein